MGPRLNINRMPVEPEKMDSHRLAAALEIASDGMWEWDQGTADMFFDSRFYTVAGYDPGEFPATFDEWAKRIHPDDREEVKKKLIASMTGGQDRYEATYRFRTRTGGWIWIHARGKVVERDSAGSPLRMIGIINDVTETKHAESVHRLSEERYRMVVENAHDGIFIAQDGLIRYANSSTKRILGRTREELAQVPIDKLIHASDRAMVVDRHHRRLRGEKVPDYYSFRALHKAGKARWLEINTVLTQWAGAPAIQAFIRDITQTKLLEKQLLQAQKMQAIGTLAGGIAHDFNNILSAMIGYTELCLNESGKAGALSSKLERVLQAGKRARDLVNQILSFSRQHDSDEKPIEIGPIIVEAVQLLRASIPTSIDMDVRMEKEAGIVQADPTRIHQIIMNLCINAAHAMEADGGRLDIQLENITISRQEAIRFLDLPPGPYVRVSVSDSGHGMSPEVCKQIFDPYFTTKPKGEGTGLGLSVVHGIVASLGGAINVYSEPNEGTTFTIYLPQICSDHNGQCRERAEIPGGRETILLVDDEALVLDMTTELLTGLGYTVVPRISSVEAVQAFRASPMRFDLVITDHNMPHMTGVELARRIMAIRKDIPVVLCSGFSAGLSEKSLKADGVQAIINKPVLNAEMAEIVRKTLDR